MIFYVWKNARAPERWIEADDIDDAADKYMETNGDVKCDCISDHITLLMYETGVVAICEENYWPELMDFGS